MDALRDGKPAGNAKWRIVRDPIGLQERSRPWANPITAAVAGSWKAPSLDDRLQSPLCSVPAGIAHRHTALIQRDSSGSHGNKRAAFHPAPHAHRIRAYDHPLTLSSGSVWTFNLHYLVCMAGRSETK